MSMNRAKLKDKLRPMYGPESASIVDTLLDSMSNRELLHGALDEARREATVRSDPGCGCFKSGAAVHGSGCSRRVP